MLNLNLISHLRFASGRHLPESCCTARACAHIVIGSVAVSVQPLPR